MVSVQMHTYLERCQEFGGQLALVEAYRHIGVEFGQSWTGHLCTVLPQVSLTKEELQWGDS